MLSAWDACYECDAIIQEAARGDLPHPNDTLHTVGVAATVVGYVSMILLMPAASAFGALSLIGGLTALAIQRRRTRRYREGVVAGELPLPGRTRWLLSGGAHARDA
jgi:hypothetical protein